MIEKAPALFQRLFSERQFVLRSGATVRTLSLPGWIQGVVVCGALALVGGMGVLAGAYHHLHNAIHRKEAEISAVSDRAAAFEGLRTALEETDKQYAEIAQQLDDAQTQLDAAQAANETLRKEIAVAEARDAVLDRTRIALEERLHGAEAALAGKTGNVAQLEKQLAESRGALKDAADARAGLQKKLAELEADSATANGNSNRLKLSLAERAQDLRRVAAERARLQTQLFQHDAGAPKSYATRLEQLLASTGIDLDRMLARFIATPPAEGGPFIHFDPKTVAQQDKEREAALKSLVEVLPLGTPLDQYTLDSPFGPRVDPFNHRMGFHTGVDLAAPYRTPVHATAPGIVTFAGVKDDYGRIVEITHAGGIMTRYAHLHRILVAPGQHVRAHQEIGELGSSGRSTGPHVHYEVVVDGVPVDPAKFLEAGKAVVLTSAVH
jgi:murein DD-endopeptidase MepM/ murein hydrolase activator NlpD